MRQRGRSRLSRSPILRWMETGSKPLGCAVGIFAGLFFVIVANRVNRRPAKPVHSANKSPGDLSETAAGEEVSFEINSARYSISEELIHRLESSFRDIYLQLLSVIQGVAFGFLAATSLSNRERLGIAQWLALLVCFFGILVIWQEYMIGATAFAWIPTVLDTIIPFSLGLGEFFVIAFATGSTRTFLLVLAIAWLSGVVAQGNYWFHARRGFEINRSSYPPLGNYVRFGFFATLSGFFGVTMLFWLSLKTSSKVLDSVLVGCALAALILILLRPIFQWNRILKRHMHGSSADGRTASSGGKGPPPRRTLRRP